jgi:hypothetical protein
MDTMTRFENDNFHILDMGLSTGQVEKYIYKYRTINQVDMFLDNSELKFSLHNEFNDPFDCCADIDTNNTLAEIEQYLIDNQVPQSIVKPMANQYFNDKPIWRKIITDAINSQIDNTGIFCGTNSPNNDLMWAHYADSNQGACMKFDISKDVKFFLFPKKVTYDDNFLSYNYIKEQGKVLDQLFRKSLKWEYENEVRIIKRGLNGLRKLNKEAVVEIIFGYKTQNNDITDIKNKVQNKGFNIKFRQTVVNPKSHKLDIINL